jgi:UDP-N-acetylglucosamine acyltransferase
VVTIHERAVVEAGAELGEDVQVGPFSYVAAGARIGDGCRLGSHVVVHGAARLGRGCQLHAGAVVADVPQDVGFDAAELTYVEIGANCVLREGVTVHRATKPGGSTRVGDDCYLMVNTHVAHDCMVGDRVVMVNGALLAGHVEVGDGVLLAGLAGAHQFVRIGRLAMLGAAAIAIRDVPPFCTCATAEASRVGGLNIVGMRRAGIDAAGRREVKEAYRILYRMGLTVSDAIEKIRETLPAGSPGLEMAEFAAGSTRGICQADRA